MTGHFGKRLRRLRGDRSQREVAEDLGIPATTLSSLEQQQTVPRGPIIQRLADHFGIPIDYFYPPDRQPTQSAREWLRHLQAHKFQTPPTIATHLGIDVSDEVKERFYERRLRPRIEGAKED